MEVVWKKLNKLLMGSFLDLALWIFEWGGRDSRNFFSYV